ncbi:ABC transporter permease, partial [Candidatus Protofrankia datiscae]
MRHALRAVFSSLPTRAAGLFIIVILTVAVTGETLAPHDPFAQDLDSALAAPGGGHWLGTDYLGRDTLSRLVAGTRETILSAVAMVALGALLGVLPGIASALLGRWSAFAALRTVDALLTLPTVIFAVAVGGLFSNGPAALVIAIGFLMAPRFFRIVRAEALAFSRTQYVESAALLGASRWWIIRRHVGRKVLPTIAVTTSITLGGAVFTSSSLNFIGLGSQPPAPTWGGMLAVTTSHLWEDPLAPLWPGLIIVLTIWSFHTLADGLREGLDARNPRNARNPRHSRPSPSRTATPSPVT